MPTPALALYAPAEENEGVPHPLRFGVDDAGGPHPLHEHPKAAEICKGLGVNLWVMHLLPPTGRYGAVEAQLTQRHDAFPDTVHSIHQCHYREGYCTARNAYPRGYHKRTIQRYYRESYYSAKNAADIVTMH